MARRARTRKVVDETVQVRCAQGWGIVREEVWQDERGEVVRYNLAFIHHKLFSRDNGRVLGYDNRHEYHHRHFMGRVEPFPYSSYAALLDLFLSEVDVLRKESR